MDFKEVEMIKFVIFGIEVEMSVGVAMIVGGALMALFAFAAMKMK